VFKGLMRPWVPLELVNILAYLSDNYTQNNCSMELAIHLPFYRP